MKLLSSFVLACFITMTAGSSIYFETSPTVVKKDLTRALVMRCALNDTQTSPGNAVVGRDVEHTVDDVMQVSSMVVMRNGVEIASVTMSSAHVLNDSTNLQVTGNVNGNSGERGYIELSWTFPSDAQAGEYKCEANAINDVGHNVVFSTSLELAVTMPTLTDLVHHIRDLETQNLLLNEKVERLNHTEDGTVNCGYSGNWPGHYGSSGRYNSVTVQFQRPYVNPPHVSLGLVFLDTYAKDTTRLYAYVEHVDTSSATIRCQTWIGHDIAMKVDWISVA